MTAVATRPGSWRLLVRQAVGTLRAALDPPALRRPGPVLRLAVAHRPDAALRWFRGHY